MNLLPWFQDDLNQWLSLIVSQQVPHAILLNGSKGLGKFKQAQQMAHIALCENLSKSGVCGQCSPCELYKVGNHPDLTIISAEKAVIKVDQIRKLSKDIRITSTKGQYRVIIVENAEQMNKASANALLKTLEEPPEKVAIILTTSEMGRLLPTIKSRCIKMDCPIPSKVLVTDWLKTNLSNSHEEIEISLLLANGSPFLAKEILENNSLNSVKVMLSDLKEILTNNKSILEVSKKWNSDGLTINLPLVAAHFLNVIKLKSGLIGDNSKSNGFFETAFDFQNTSDLNAKVLTFIKSLHLFSFRLGTALKKELLLEELLIQWKLDFK